MRLVAMLVTNDAQAGLPRPDRFSRTNRLRIALRSSIGRRLSFFPLKNVIGALDSPVKLGQDEPSFSCLGL